MNILFCADVRLGAVCGENLDVAHSRKWQTARSEKFEELLDDAARENAAYVALFGMLFGRERVPEATIDALFNAVKAAESITVLAFLNPAEYKRISYRNDIPGNFVLIDRNACGTFTDDEVALRTDEKTVEFQFGDNDSVFVKSLESGRFVVSGITSSRVVPGFEPTGFDETLDTTYGYGILEWNDDQLGKFEYKGNASYAFRSVELKIQPDDDKKEIVRKINNAVRTFDHDTFLRLTITGRSAFGLVINSDALKNQLQKHVFYAEVYDNTVMDINEEAFETDISLRSEFVRLALQDDSLSESERNRLISFGWNALNGEDVFEE